MATTNDFVKCICSDKKVVEVDRKTWKLFNEMVPMEGYDMQLEPVEMDHVKSTALKKLLTYSVRISDTTCFSDVLKTWMYDEFLPREGRLASLMDLIKTADFLDIESLETVVIQYVEDKSEEEISYMVCNENLRSLLKIFKLARFYLKNTEKVSSVVLPLLSKSQEEFSQIIAKEDILGLIKLIEVAKPLCYEKLCKAVHNLILSKSIDQLSLEIHNQNLKGLIKIFEVARAEDLHSLKDMVVQYFSSKSDEELVPMVSTELSGYQSTYLIDVPYLRMGTTLLDVLFKGPGPVKKDQTLNQIPIEEAGDGSNQIPIEEAGDGSKKKEGWTTKRTKTNKLKLVPCISKKPSTKKLTLKKKKNILDN